MTRGVIADKVYPTVGYIVILTGESDTPGPALN